MLKNSLIKNASWPGYRSLLILIGAIELALLLMMIKSVNLSILSLLVLFGLLLIFKYPEFGFGLALNTNTLLSLFFDNVSLEIPVPVQISFLMLTLGGTVFYILKKGLYRDFRLGFPNYIALIIGLLMIVGLLYSTDRSNGIQKIIFYFIININLIVLPVIFIRDYKTIKNIFYFAYIFGLLLAFLAFLIALSAPAYLRFQISETTSPIWLARSMGTSVLTGIFLITIAKRYSIKLLILSTFPFFIYVIFRTWSRAPLIGLFGCVLLYFILQPSKTKLQKLAFIIPATAAAAVMLLRSSSQLSARLQSPLTMEWSTAFRLIAWFRGLEDFLAAPLFGIGTGSFSLKTYIGDFRYPHNLFLELACENGIAGLILILTFVYIVIRYGLKAIRSYHQSGENVNVQLSIASFTFFIFTLWNAMFSGDIVHNEVIWLAAGLIYILYYPVRQKNTKIIS